MQAVPDKLPAGTGNQHHNQPALRSLTHCKCEQISNKLLNCTAALTGLVGMPLQAMLDKLQAPQLH